MPGTILCTRNTNNSAQNKSLTFTETIFVVEEDISKILKQIFNILCVRNRKKRHLWRPELPFSLRRLKCHFSD